MSRTSMVWVALLIVIIDQASKYYLVSIINMPVHSPIMLTPFFNLVMVWNHGVSFGMFSGMNAKWFLVGTSLIICGLLWHMSKDAYNTLHKVAYGMVIGGALGNVIDRFHYGAVADFFDFHIRQWHYPAFNVADMAIVCGVIGLLWCELSKKKPAD